MLTVDQVSPELMAPQFYDKINNCHSLRSVRFERIEDVHAQLDAIEAYQSVKQWIIDFGYIDISNCVEERLRKMLSERSYNSLLFENHKGKLEIAQITQQFKISPVSYF